nr:hypothetical protein CFP56_23059 [Quercus suber]
MLIPPRLSWQSGATPRGSLCRGRTALPYALFLRETAFDINVFKLCSASSFVVAFPAQFQRVRSILLH